MTGIAGTALSISTDVPGAPISLSPPLPGERDRGARLVIDDCMTVQPRPRVARGQHHQMAVAPRRHFELMPRNVRGMRSGAASAPALVAFYVSAGPFFAASALRRASSSFIRIDAWRLSSCSDLISDGLSRVVLEEVAGFSFGESLEVMAICLLPPVLESWKILTQGRQRFRPRCQYFASRISGQARGPNDISAFALNVAA